MTASSAEDTVLFVHIPKTAGTTVGNLIRSFYPQDQRLNIVAETKLDALPTTLLAEQRIIFGHHPYGAHLALGLPPRYFTFLRDPVARTVSAFVHTAERVDAAHHGQATGMTLRQFVEKNFDVTCDNYQTRYLLGPEGFDFKAAPACTETMFEIVLDHLEREFMFVGVVEDFDKSLLLLANLLGWPTPYYVPANISRAAISIDASTLSAIHDRNVFDHRLREYAIARLNAMANAQPAGFFDRLEIFVRHTKLIRGARRVSSGAAASSGHYTIHHAERAFDGLRSTAWISAQQGPGVSGEAWIGYDFGHQRPIIRRFAICQTSLPPAAPVARIRLEASDDGFAQDVRTIEEFVVPADSEMHTRDVTAIEAARAWRVVAAADPGGAHWGVDELAFSEQTEPSRTVDRMETLWRTKVGDAICYHHAAGRPARAAFDGDAATWWESADADPLIDGIAWIGFDLGPEMAFSVRRFVLWQQARHAVSRVALQCSDDGFQSDIRTIGEFSLPRDGFRNSFAVNAHMQGRFWRLIARSPVGGLPWRVTGIEFWDDEGPLAGVNPP